MQCRWFEVLVFIYLIIDSNIVSSDDYSANTIYHNSNDNTEIVTTDELVNLAVSSMNNCQADLNIQNPINITIQSFNAYNDIIPHNIANRNRYDLLNFHQQLVNNNINIDLNNKYIPLDLSNELYQVHFKNALNNDLILANNILQISLNRTNSKAQEMFNNIEIVKNMSIDNKQKLSNYLLDHWQQTIKFLKCSINYCQDNYNYFGILHPINNQIVSNIQHKIRTIFGSVLKYLNDEKEVLLELGLEQYM